MKKQLLQKILFCVVAVFSLMTAGCLEWSVETYGDRSEKETIIFDGKGNLKTEGK